MKGFDKAISDLQAIAKRTADPKLGLQAVGRMARARHESYFRSHIGAQPAIGGGPPGDPWRGLRAATAEQKNKRGKTRKLIDRGTLMKRFRWLQRGDSVLVYNEDLEKVANLQGRLGFTVVATDPERQDPEMLDKANRIMANFIWDGKAKE